MLSEGFPGGSVVKNQLPAAAAKSLQSCNPPGSPSLGFSRQEQWSRLPFPSPMHESESEREVAQSCLTLSDPMGCSLPGSPVHGIFQARVLEWGAVACRYQLGRPRLDSWVGKIPWRRKWQPTPGFLLGESHGQRSLAGYSTWGHKKLNTT